MTNLLCLPDLRLTKEVSLYQIVSDTVPWHPFFATSKLAFNVGGAPIKFDGTMYSRSCLFCISSEPPMRMLEKGEGEIVLVELRPGALFRLFGLDGARYGGEVVEADSENFRHLHSIFANLEAAPNTLADRIAVLDGAFLSLAKNARPYGIGEKFQFVADVTKGAIGVSDAAERLGVNQRTLERDCRRRFGRTPKRILRGWRIFHALATANMGNGPVRWKSTDPGANFSDQSHFLRDFKDLSGLSPTQMHDYFSGERPEIIYHPRGDLDAPTQIYDAEIAAEYDANFEFRAFGPEFVEELGLLHWEPAN